MLKIAAIALVAAVVVVALSAAAPAAAARQQQVASSTNAQMHMLASMDTAHMTQTQKEYVNNLTLSFRVCGYYCGPGWCSNQWIDESTCVSTGVWGIAPEPAEQCTDGCCRAHDKCCGSGIDRASCNAGIVQCLDNNDCSGLCSDAVWAAMKIVSEWCCGSSCPSYSGFAPISLAGKKFCSKKANVMLAFGEQTVEAFALSAARPCSVAVPYSLDQKYNRVGFGSVTQQGRAKTLASMAGVLGSKDSEQRCILSAQTPEQRLVMQDLADASKTWYMPNTKELFVTIGRDKSFFNFEQC